MFDAVTRFFDPFYSQARRWFGLGSRDLDTFVESGATAKLEAGGILTVSQPTGSEFTYSTPKHLHRASIAAWVNDFNRRAAENRGPVRDEGTDR